MVSKISRLAGSSSTISTVYSLNATPGRGTRSNGSRTSARAWPLGDAPGGGSPGLLHGAAAGRAPGKRDGHQLPRAPLANEGKGVRAAVAEPLAQVKVIRCPERGQVAVHLDPRIPHPLP